MEYTIQEIISGAVVAVVPGTFTSMATAQAKCNQLNMQAAVTNQQRAVEGLPPISYKVV